jgi:hypothetical protein
VNDDQAQDSESRLYARGPAAEDRSSVETIYVKADPAAMVVPDRSRFYDVGYRTELRRMVIEVEAPIYFDVLVERIVRAHGIQRSGENVQNVIAAALGRRRFRNSRDGNRNHLAAELDDGSQSGLSRRRRPRPHRHSDA